MFTNSPVASSGHIRFDGSTAENEIRSTKALGNGILGSPQDPEYRDHGNHRESQENDASLVMEPSGKKSRVYAGSQFRDGEDTKAILGDGEGNARRSAATLRHQERRNRCAKTMVVTTSMRLDRILLHSLRNFDVQSRNRDHDAILGRRHPTSAEHDSCREGGLLLQEFDDPAKANSGMGTIKKSKQRGNRSD